MLKITIPETELWDESIHEFIYIKGQSLNMEHSLVSLSKWEAKWHIPFLDNNTKKTQEQLLDYFRCMTLTQNVDPNVYKAFDAKIVKIIQEYIDNPMTATWFTEEKTTKKNSEIVTSELIYYWMVALNIPFECQKWHLNRLLTLVRVCNVKNKPPKKMSKRDIMSRNRALNSQRKGKLHTNG